MRLTGSGVLVYDRKGKEIHVLLGRGSETPGWRQGSHKWSAFSGKVEFQEGALEAAAREFTEEAWACVPLRDDSAPTSTAREAVEQSTLVKGEHLLYCTYQLRMPYAQFDKVFADTRAQLLELNAVFRCFYRAKKLADAAPRFFLLTR